MILYIVRGQTIPSSRFTPTCVIRDMATKVVSSNPAYGEVYSIQHYVRKFVSDL